MLNMQKPEAVLFDLDGTLLDTAPDLGNALNHVLTHYKLPTLSYEDYRDHASHGANGLLKLGFGDQFENYDMQVLRTRFLDFYEQNICIGTRTFTGIDELISAIELQSMPWGIVTNKPGWLTDILLTHFELFQRCAVVVSGDTLPQRKPDPAPLLYAAEKMGIAVDKIWYIGDAERDIQAANSAGMISVVAEYGYIGDQRAVEWDAKFSIQQPQDLVSQLA